MCPSAGVIASTTGEVRREEKELFSCACTFGHLPVRPYLTLEGATTAPPLLHGRGASCLDPPTWQRSLQSSGVVVKFELVWAT